MSNSPEFQRFKRLYHERSFPIKNVSITDETGEIVFEDSTDGSETSVVGDANDFIHALWAVKKSIQDGKNVLIDVTATPAGSIEQYYDNLEYFLPNQPTRTPNDEISRIMQEISTGETTLPDNINIRDALNAALDEEMDNPALHTVIKNYYRILAYELIQLKGCLEIFEHRSHNIIYNHDRFKDFYQDIEETLRLEYLTKNPESGYKAYHETCITDVEYIMKQLLAERKVSDQEWRALLQNTDSTLAETDGVTIRSIEQGYDTEEEIPDHAVGRLDGEITISRTLKQYAYYYETAKHLFRDIVATLQSGEDTDGLSSTYRVVEWLKSNEDLSWTDPIVPALRNGPYHASVEINNDIGRVRIYNNQQRTRSVKQKLTYEELLSTYYEFVDLVMAVLWAFTLTDHMLQFEYLKSNEFKFRVVENLPPNVL